MLFRSMFAIDAHLDLSMNALEWNRDLRWPVAEINARERARGWKDKPDRGNATVAFPELRRGGFGLVTPRVIASGAPESSVLLYRISSEGQGHMPLIGARFVDDRGVDLIREWIRDLRPLTNAPVTGTREFLEFARSRDRALSEWKAAKSPEAKVHAAAPLLAGPSGAKIGRAHV